jgi:hypothetical protein
MNGNVELVDKQSHLYTNTIAYDVKNRVAQYPDSGMIINGDNRLTSRIGVYYTSRKLFNFKDDVRIINPQYIMTADTMDYNAESGTAIFTGPSEMTGDSIYIYCEKGWYDTRKNLTRVSKNALIDNRQQIIRGDSIFYNDSTGFGESFGNISINDTANNIIVEGNYAWYYKNPERFMATDSALFIQVSEKDSLYLHADTISAITVPDTTTKGYRLLRAYFGSRVFSRELQGKCDSLSYSFKDSVIRMYYSPVLWSEEHQLVSPDSIALFTRNSQAERLELYNSASVISQVDSLRFNQIKGKSLTGYFRDNKIYKVSITGNGESIYYILDGDELSGRNVSKCASMDIFIENGKVKEIFQYKSPQGVIYPPSPLPEKEKNLPGFTWLDESRPRKIIDLFK